MKILLEIHCHFVVDSAPPSGGTRGRLAGARAPARKFFPASPFVK